MKIRLFTIPNILTLLNLLCGCIAAVLALHCDLQGAFWFIIAAAALDFLDGFAARLLKAYSPIGKELDSLADMISFGFTPSAILFNMYYTAGGVAPWGFAVFIVAAFSALRLAKFNIDERQTHGFIGMPTPACAIFIASAGYLFSAGVYDIGPYAILVAAAVLSYLLVSNIPMFSLKFTRYGFKGNELRYTFLALSLVALSVWGVTAVPFIIAAYVAVSIARRLAAK